MNPTILYFTENNWKRWKNISRNTKRIILLIFTSKNDPNLPHQMIHRSLSGIYVIKTKISMKNLLIKKKNNIIYNKRNIFYFVRLSFRKITKLTFSFIPKFQNMLKKCRSNLIESNLRMKALEYQFLELFSLRRYHWFTFR